MDKQSPRILVRVNGAKAEYEEQKEERKDEFQWILPEKLEPSNNIVQLRPEPVSKPVQKRAGAGKRIAATVGAAVILGTGFGFGMLQLLNGEGGAASSSAAVVPAPAEQKSAPAEASVKLQSMQLHMVQGGVFSKKENGEAALTAAKKQGLPAYLAAEDGRYRLFIGLASNKETAEKLRAERQGAYKAWQVPARSIPAAYEPYGSLIVKGESLFSSLIEQSSLVYASGKPDAAKQTELEKGIQSLLKETGKVKQEDVKKFLTYVTLSHDALKDYEKRQGAEAFSKLQQLLFEGLSSYEGLLSKA